MSKVAWLFPGQGSQFVGMGSKLAQYNIKAMSILKEADEILGFPLSTLMSEGPEDQLKLTKYTQPALLTHSAMVVYSLQDKLPKPDFVAGHSLGEYSALVAGNAITFGDGLKTVYERGRIMQSALPKDIGTMAAIIGTNSDDIIKICNDVQQETEMIVVPANFNGPGQIVIAGHNNAVDIAIERLKSLGCKAAIKLPVSAPFHSPLMLPAKKEFELILKNLTIVKPICPLINNIDAAIITDPNIIRDGLIRQITGSVLWENIIKILFENNVTQFFELGSGSILKNLLKRQAKDVGVSIQVNSIADHNDLYSFIKN